MRLLENYSFPAEVIHHHEIQSIGKKRGWGGSVGTGGPLSSE